MKDLLPLETDADFAEFWNLYPRKRAKLAARKAYWSIRRKVPHAMIMDGLRAYPFSPEPGFQPHAATWLNAGGYLIEQDTPPPTVIVSGHDKPTSMTSMRALRGDDPAVDPEEDR